MQSKQSPKGINNTEEETILAEKMFALKDDIKKSLPIKSGKPRTGDALQLFIDKACDNAIVQEISLGFALLLKKRELGHGQYIAWLKDNGYLPRRMQAATQVATFVAGLSSSNARRVTHLPKRKLQILASAPPALIDDLFDNDELNDEMSREQMRDIIRLQKKTADLETKLDTAVLQNNELKDQLKNKGVESRFPQYVDTARHESASLTYRIELNVDDLAALYNDLRQQEDLLTNVTPENQMDLHVAYASLYHNLNGAVAKASQLLMAMREELDPDDTTSMIDHACIFDEKEAAAAIKTKQILQLEHEHDKLKRQQTQKTSKAKRTRKAK